MFPLPVTTAENNVSILQMPDPHPTVSTAQGYLETFKYHKPKFWLRDHLKVLSCQCYHIDLTLYAFISDTQHENRQL
jgi:hypothetical protein